ncbi:hypothetical protein GCM10020001_087950 [Nonomuraea salmonea]
MLTTMAAARPPAPEFSTAENASTMDVGRHCMASAYDRKSETSVAANASPISAGSRRPSVGLAPMSGAFQAERSGVVMMSNIVTISPRCDGLKRMSMFVSMPRMVCHIMSANPNAANAGIASSPARYPAGTAASP